MVETIGYTLEEIQEAFEGPSKTTAYTLESGVPGAGEEGAKDVKF